MIALDFAAIINHLGGEIAGIAERTETVVELVTKLDPDVVVMDVGIGGDVDSIDTADMITKCFDVPVVFATGDDDPVTRFRIDRATQEEPVLKPVGVAALRDAILRACKGDA
jgi:DNA-binding NarL/FixJ family response regulator